MPAKTHGEANPRTPLCRAWDNMRQRCCNPRLRGWKNYGGRGIKVCERWLKFENFRDDMAPHPGKGWTLARIDTNGDYEPENCRWATYTTQNRNMRSTKITRAQADDIIWRVQGGETHRALGKEFGLSHVTVGKIARGEAWV